MRYMIWPMCLTLGFFAPPIYGVGAVDEPSTATYVVNRASAPPKIDGVLDEFDWAMSERIHLLKFSHDPEDGKPLRESTQVAALWDDHNLYLGFVVQDREVWATIRERDARLWPEECVEFYLDPDGTGQRYVEAQVNSVNNIRDLLVDGNVTNPVPAQFDLMARWDFRHLESAIKIYKDPFGRDIGWTLEIAIPWSDLAFSRRSFPPRPGDEMRINFYRYERSHDGKLPLELSEWSPVPGDFHDPPRFGTLVFTEAK
jgi:cellulose/xylan binding protein with CBM9 domain